MKTRSAFQLAVVVTIGLIAGVSAADPVAEQDSHSRPLDEVVTEQQQVIDRQQATIAEKNELIALANAEMIRALETLDDSLRSNRELRNEIADIKRQLEQVVSERDRHRQEIERLQAEANRYRRLVADYQADRQTPDVEAPKPAPRSTEEPERDRYGRVIVRP